MKNILVILLLSFGPVLYANNISVTNVILTGQNTIAGANNSANFMLVQFNLNWQNSWRTATSPANWDAAWVFIKYRVGTGEWQHAWLNNTGHTAPTGSTINVGLQNPGTAFNTTTNPGIGVFIYRSATGTGTFSLSNVQLRWNYGTNGVTDNSIVDVQVFAIEMVYVPQGGFYAGDGTTTAVQGHFRNGSTNTPLLISSENALTLGGTANGNLANNNATGMMYADDFNDITTQTLPVAFPKGFKAFYGMKYEISQQGYVDFLNTLTRDQQANRVYTIVTSGTTSVANRFVMSNTNTSQNRNGIRCDSTLSSTTPITFYCDLNGNGTGGEANDGQWIACNWLNYMDVAAYMDWSGLRPMTELEFEKSCRGTLVAVANEYAWGSTIITGVSDIANGGSTNETSITAGANAIYNVTPFYYNEGPKRVGLFATGTSSRLQSGAGYYGMMELSGNVWEISITVGNTAGRAFTGFHGNGALSANGNANETDWPGFSNGEVTGSTGTGYRGGDCCYSIPTEILRVSTRNLAVAGIVHRYSYYGGRGVRVSP